MVPLGTQVYSCDDTRVPGRGLEYAPDELVEALKGNVAILLRDDPGRQELAALLEGASGTGFELGELERVLGRSPDALEAWQVGELLAEAHLASHSACSFPWPVSRDLKNPRSRLSGVDLIGFESRSGATRFTFGEVKTSAEHQYPPSVAYDLSTQLASLRADESLRDQVVRYLGLRADNRDWRPSYEAAAQAYLQDSRDVLLVGFMVRDVEPRRQDLEGRVMALSTDAGGTEEIRLTALYLPRNAIDSLPQDAMTSAGLDE